ncbi:MAG: PRC-barrel domain-containing protein [Dongiales bacterium]|jgi:sporulation protein YlmC with PRC-barrel domain
MATSNETLKQKEIGRLIAADKVQGTPVSNAAGERIGSIENVMIDKPSGRVAYAVMSFGGVLGFGKSRYPLPWDLLEFDPTLDSYVVDLDPDILEGAPVYEEGRTNWADEAWGRRVYDYYKVPPYWI